MVRKKPDAATNSPGATHRLEVDMPRKNTKFPRICEGCGTTFTPKYANAIRFCSLPCANASMRFTLEQEFWRHVDKRGPDECWIWQGTIGANGYGAIMDYRNPSKKGVAHRVGWELANGPFPAGMLACHRCDVRACVNPSHIFPGTAADNTHDMMNKGRKPIGEHCPTAKLTDDQVREIRRLAASGMHRNAIGARFGITANNAWYIIKRRTWKHIE